MRPIIKTIATAAALLIIGQESHSQIETLAYTVTFNKSSIEAGTEINSSNFTTAVKITDSSFKGSELTNPYAVNCHRSKNGIKISKPQRGEAAIGFGISTTDQSAISKVLIYTTNTETTNTFSCSFNLDKPSIIQDISSDHTYTINNKTSIFDVYIESTWGEIDIQKIEFYVKSGDPETSIIVNPHESVSIDKEIKVKDVRIRANTNDDTGQILVNAPIEAHNGITYEKEIDDSRWYFFSLPYDCPISNSSIISADGTKWQYGSSATGGNYIIRYYDEEEYANGKPHGWRDHDWHQKPLKANQGYIIGLFPSGSSATIRFKSSAPYRIEPPQEKQLDFGANYVWHNSNDTVAAKYSGWNLIGSPYLHSMRFGSIIHNTGTWSNSMLSMPNKDGKTYTQKSIDEILYNENIHPCSAFFIQVGSNQAPTISSSIENPEPSAAPMLEKSKRQTFRCKIELADIETGASDETNIISSPGATRKYEIGMDLMKMKGYAQIPQIYSIEQEDELAFNTQELGNSTTIKLGAYIPKGGEYIFKLNSTATDSDYTITLYDREIGSITDMSSDTYAIRLKQGEYRERFELNIDKKGDIATELKQYIGEYKIYKSQNMLHIENMTNNTNIEVYDISGKKIYNVDNTQSNITIFIPYKGVFYILMHDAKNTAITKITN